MLPLINTVVIRTFAGHQHSILFKPYIYNSCCSLDHSVDGQVLYTQAHNVVDRYSVFDTYNACDMMHSFYSHMKNLLTIRYSNNVQPSHNMYLFYNKAIIFCCGELQAIGSQPNKNLVCVFIFILLHLVKGLYI